MTIVVVMTMLTIVCFSVRTMLGDFDIDLDEHQLNQMQQLTSPCESHLYESLLQLDSSTRPHQLDYSPLSCTFENSLMFDIPTLSPTTHHQQVRADVTIKDQHNSTPSVPDDSLAGRSISSNVDIKPVPKPRGRKRLPETVCIIFIFV